MAAVDAEVVMGADLAAILEVLGAMREEQRAQREDLEHLTRRLLSPQDRAALRLLLPLIFALVGEQAWTARAVYATAQVAPHADALRELLDDWASEPGGLRAFGRFLARCDGAVHAGLRLVALRCEERDGGLYQIERVTPA